HALTRLVDMQRQAVHHVSRFDGHEACLYHWTSPCFRYVGVARRDRVNRGDRPGVIQRRLEQLTFTHNKSLPGAHKLRYKFAQRQPLGRSMFHAVQTIDVGSIFNRERELIRQCRPSANGAPKAIGKPRSAMPRRRPPRNVKSRLLPPTCRELERLGPVPGRGPHATHPDIGGTACSAEVSPGELGRLTFVDAYRRVSRHVADGSGVRGPVDTFCQQWRMLLLLWFGSQGMHPPWPLLEGRLGDADVVLFLLPMTVSIVRPRAPALARRRLRSRLRMLGLPGLTVHQAAVAAPLAPQDRTLIHRIVWPHRALSAAQTWRWLKQASVVAEPIPKWNDRINAPAVSSRACIAKAFEWSDSQWGRRAQVGAPLGIQFCMSPAVRSFERPRDKDWDKYCELTAHLDNVPPDHVVTRDDKQNRRCWHLPESYYIAALILYIVSSPRWFFSKFAPDTASAVVLNVLKLLVPNRLHSMFRLGERIDWLPCLYTTLKSKCYD
ncbi:unnamed protein product, partial [Prorocentrum cordatum]